MIDDIKLPPLPKASKMYDIPGYDEEELKDYARAAVLADRALLDERDELAKDAARYRYIRDKLAFAFGESTDGCFFFVVYDGSVDDALENCADELESLFTAGGGV